MAKKKKLTTAERKEARLRKGKPPIGNKLLYVTSGHYAKYGKDAFHTGNR